MKVFLFQKVEVVNSCILVKYKALLDEKFIKSGIGLNYWILAMKELLNLDHQRNA